MGDILEPSEKQRSSKIGQHGTEKKFNFLFFVFKKLIWAPQIGPGIRY